MSDQIKTLKDMLETTVRKYPDRVASSFVGGEPISYASFLERVQGLGGVLQELGVNPGDKVAIIGENMPNWAITYFAITTMGAIAVPILQEFHYSAVHHIIRHSEAKVVVASRRYIHKVESDNFPHLNTVVLMDDLSVESHDEHKTRFQEAADAASDKIGQMSDAAHDKFGKYSDVASDKFGKYSDVASDKFSKYSDVASDKFNHFSDVASGKLNKLSEAAKKFMERRAKEKPGFVLSSDSIAAILYTSGTTGHSKGVVLSHGNLISNVLAGVITIPVFETDRFLSVLPMAHTYECTVGLLVPVHCGSAVYYLQKPPTPRSLLPAMQVVKPTVINVVPLIIEKIYKSRIKPKLSRKGIVSGLMKFGVTRKQISRMAGKKLIEAFGGELRCMCIGGAALSPEVEVFLADANFPYAIGYGMTETSPLLAGSRPGLQRLRGIGPKLPGVELMIRNPDPKTGEGEVLAKGPNVMQGYYKAPNDTKDTFNEDGWLLTGDLGVFDEDGYLYIRGRLKNVIIGPSGENIYPEEVESIINGCDYVLESLVFESGNQVVARIHLNYEALDEEFGVKGMIESEVRKKTKALLDAIREETNSKVSTFARLNRVIEQVEPFEKTPTQKIKRFIYLDN